MFAIFSCSLSEADIPCSMFPRLAGAIPSCSADAPRVSLSAWTARFASLNVSPSPTGYPIKVKIDTYTGIVTELICNPERGVTWTNPLARRE